MQPLSRGWRSNGSVTDRIKRFEEVFVPVMELPSPALAFSSFVGSAAAFAAVALARHPKEGGAPCTLVITPGIPEADTFFSDLKVLEAESGVRILDFPPSLEDDAATTAARLRVSAALGSYVMRPYPLVIVAPVGALQEGVRDAALVNRATVVLEVGGENPTFAETRDKLAAAGYERFPEVTSPGTYSVRGGVIDAWSPEAEAPIRAEFFGDDLESLRVFDPGLQTSTARVDSTSFGPVSLKGGATRLLEELLPTAATIFAITHDAYPYPIQNSARFRRVFAGDPPPAGVPTASFPAAPLPGFAELGGEAARHPELLETVRARLNAHLAALQKRGTCVVEDDELSGGFEIPGLAIVAKSDRVFLGRRSLRKMAAARGVAGERLSSVMDLEIGEYVVHVDYGVGRFMGSTEIEVNGKHSEVFTIEYADGGKLHVPVAHAHLLSRYVGVKGESVKCHRLDGKRWAKEKSLAQKAVQDLAASLLENAARRQVMPGFAYDVNAPGIEDFENAFPWEETPDQRAAIEAVKEDLAAVKPMDRLICGDAGYGKTEVALRAAFIAAMNGKQVVVLAPTTVLAEQHYETFLSRFEGTPLRVEAMSRFQSPEARKGTRARLASGATDVVIGTHALLSEKVSFHDLGLIIIDEEQRFGVKHKEWLKNLRTTADVLTLSATPIPRTLYLSMTGARDLSLLRTPPRERVAVETNVVRDLDATVRSAIEREIMRGGQVYFLYNRVSTIARAAKRLKALVPTARIEVAHGQMSATILAAKMRHFAKGDFDILLCTTIVESGLDIPRANTILVDRADRFGLAELYQLRGRVGRSSRQGYAYFLLPAMGSIDSDARERLAALKKHAGLGAGFNLAMRDLEIRGAGNLLGHEQSGHIAAIGFQLYCQLLQRTIARLKGEELPLVVDVSVNLDFLNFSPGAREDDSAASLPYDYIEEEAQRMDFHKRLAEVSSVAQVCKLRAELADRYGKLPPAAIRLVKLTEFRVRCALVGVTRLDVKEGRAVFYKNPAFGPAFVDHTRGKTAEQRLASLFHMLDKIELKSKEKK